MTPKEAIVGSRTERKKENTKQKIVCVAMQLFKERGLNETTMEQIAEEADIAKGTLYNYFSVKEAIISEYIEQISLERNSERILSLQDLPDTRARLVLVLGELMGWVKIQKEIFEKYFMYQIQNMISLRPNKSTASGFHLLGTEIIRLGQKSAEIRGDLPFDILIALFEFIFIKVAQRFYQDPQTFMADEVIEQYVDLFMSAVKNGSPNGDISEG
jgi:AcrR family transcriptional regulator